MSIDAVYTPSVIAEMPKLPVFKSNQKTLPARIARAAATETLHLGSIFVTGWGMTYINRAILWSFITAAQGLTYGLTQAALGTVHGINYVANTVFQIPPPPPPMCPVRKEIPIEEDNICPAHYPDLNTPLTYDPEICPVMEAIYAPTPKPTSKFTPINTAFFLMFMSPANRIATFAANKIFSYIKPTPSRRSVATVISKLTVPTLSASMCYAVGIEIYPSEVARQQITFMILGTAIAGVIGTIKYLNKWVDSTQTTTPQELNTEIERDKTANTPLSPAAGEENNV